MAEAAAHSGPITVLPGERLLASATRAALDLSPAQQAEFRRLVKTLRNAKGYRLLFAEFDVAPERDAVRAAMQALLQGNGSLRPHHVVIDLGTTDAPVSVDALEGELMQRAAPDALIEFVNGNHWLWDGRDATRLAALNVRRDAFARCAPGLHLWWVSGDTLREIATRAPDLWSWRSGVFSFQSGVWASDTTTRPPDGIDYASGSRWLTADADLATRAKRIAALRSMLAEATSAEERWPLLLELGGIYRSIGELTRAEQQFHLALDNIPEGEDAEWSRAVALGEIADVLYARGELDEALRIWREEELPVYEKLGDVRERALTLGRIADVLTARGEFDEALRIRREEQLPVYEKLGDVGARAITMGKIADVLHARGELDEALRILREGVLPAFEKLGDARSRAVTLDMIADVLSARGEFDEALRIRREEALPVYEKLGDVRERAVTQGKIAAVLYARGEIEEALRIRWEEELPVYEKRGDVLEMLVCRANIGAMLMTRRQPGDLDEAAKLLALALADAERLRLQRDVAQIRELIAQLGRR